MLLSCKRIVEWQFISARLNLSEGNGEDCVVRYKEVGAKQERCVDGLKG